MKTSLRLSAKAEVAYRGSATKQTSCIKQLFTEVELTNTGYLPSN